MPGMDGATLLARVRELDPSAVRIVLSGQAELRTMARAAGVAHRLLAKPCPIDELAHVIERSCALQEIIGRVDICRRTAGASALPSVPRLYGQLTELLASGEGGAEDVARIVERDMAMAAKLLQLANSAYFGRRHPVSRVREAVVYLGLDALRALALSSEVFSRFPVDRPIAGFSLEQLQQHCSRVARLASAIWREHGSSDEVFAAGLLHDIGLLVIAAWEGDELARIVAVANDEGRSVYDLERERHGVTHAELGASLLALWGLAALDRRTRRAPPRLSNAQR
jgi:HD-like signal output (HDOD) protein